VSRSTLPPTPRFIRSASLTGYVKIARSFGLDPYRLLKEAGLDRSCLADPDIKIRASAVYQLLEISTRAARVEDFGLRMSETRRLSNLGPLALAMRDAGTLRDALQAASRYVCLHTDSLALSLKEMAELAIFAIEPWDDGNSPLRQGRELAVGVAYGAVQQLLGSLPKIRQVWFSHSAPKNISRHRRMLGPQVEFGRSITGLLFVPDDLDAPLPGADPVMARHVRRYLDPMLPRAHETVSEKVRQLVSEQLSTGRCSAEQMARTLGMDRRTLQRHLGRQNETFTSIVDAVRSPIWPSTIWKSGSDR
jgi:hypothetical protein